MDDAIINVDNKIKNIYYMLCYSFYGERLNAKNESKLGTETFDNIYNLFSVLLCLLLKDQIKKGIYKNYNNEFNEIKFIRGKVDISETIKNNSMVNKRVVCEYDEFTENILLNRIIKTTIMYLLKSNKIGNQIKQQLRKNIIYFNNVDIIEIKSIKWDAVRFNRNNHSYIYCIELCKLILEGLIVSDQKGNVRFQNFLDDKRVSSIYENFLRAYFNKHYPELHAKSKILHFSVDDEETDEMIPVMKTDITLKYEERMLIIDAKFYSKILNDNCGKSKVISSANIFQILSYVDNQDLYKTGNVMGMLLYAQTIDEPTICIRQNMNKHTIFIKTLDLNDNWDNIAKSLNIIAEAFKYNKFQ